MSNETIAAQASAKVLDDKFLDAIALSKEEPWEVRHEFVKSETVSKDPLFEFMTPEEVTWVSMFVFTFLSCLILGMAIKESINSIVNRTY